MADSRLFLVDTETHDWVLLAKGWNYTGWELWDDSYLAEFLASRDLDADLALFTEGNRPKECGPLAWKPEGTTSDIVRLVTDAMAKMDPPEEAAETRTSPQKPA